MKKVEGLKFLMDNFPQETVSTLFIDDVLDLDKFDMSLNNGEFYRVRCANKNGSELKLPMISIYDFDTLKEYIKIQKQQNNDFNFIIHKVDNNYFYPNFCGTIATYVNSNIPGIVIDIQRVTKEMIDLMDTSKVRPRDWEVCVSYKYDFMYKIPFVINYGNVNLELLKEPINKAFYIGSYIYDWYVTNDIYEDSYTRFNIYKDCSIILNDHRSTESFINNNKKDGKVLRYGKRY